MAWKPPHLRASRSLADLSAAEVLSTAPLLQLAEFDAADGSSFRVPSGAANVFSLPQSSPDMARAYLQASMRRSNHLPWVDLIVVLDDSRVLSFGPPMSWELGVAAKVQRGDLRVGIVRVFRAGTVADSGMLTKATQHSRLPNAAPAPTAAPASSDGGDAAAAERSSPRPLGGVPLNRSQSGSLSKILARALRVGVKSDPGGCSHMEDTHLVHAPKDADYAFVGVFDGHGGSSAANFCRENLHINVMASSSFRSGDPRAALRDGFRKTESDLIYEQRTRHRRSSCGESLQPGGDDGFTASERSGAGCCGSTVLLMLLQLESVHVAWLGDCRAVLCRGGAAFALTTDHCLKDEAERARALADGGTVESNRLGGFLEVARALGDFDHTLGRKPAGLSAQPELRTQPLLAGDEFVILGSDGLWGVISPDDAVRLARSELQAYDGDVELASEKLVEVAQKRHADDNITAMVVVLNFAAEREAPRERPRLRLMPRRATAAGGGGGPADERTSNSSSTSASSLAPSLVSERASERYSIESAPG